MLMRLSFAGTGGDNEGGEGACGSYSDPVQIEEEPVFGRGNDEAGVSRHHVVARHRWRGRSRAGCLPGCRDERGTVFFLTEDKSSFVMADGGAWRSAYRKIEAPDVFDGETGPPDDVQGAVLR